MQKFLYFFRYSQFLISYGLYRELLKHAWDKFFGRVLYIGITMEIESFESPIFSRMSLFERPIEKGDHILLTSVLSDRALQRNERHEAARRLAMLEIDLKTCYVVEDINRNVRFLQWLIPYTENEKLQMFFGDWYPLLSPDEGLMESVYVFPKYRGTGILACAEKRIVDVASRSGMKRIKAIIPAWNSNSLASFMRLGFKPYQIKIERKYFGLRWRRIIPFTSSMNEQIIKMYLPHAIASLLFKAKTL
jgi:GNAT superfamily N-acetyltransferase